MHKALVGALVAVAVGGAVLSAPADAQARPCGYWRHGYFHRTPCRRVVVAVRPGVVVVRPGGVVVRHAYRRGWGCWHRRWDPYMHRYVSFRGRC